MALIPEADGAQLPTKPETAEGRDFRSGYSTFDIVIRLGLIGLLIYWALKVVGPFVTVALWSAILVVALYPLFEWLTRQLRSPKLAAVLLTLLCLAIVIGPVAWLGFAIIGGAEFVVRALDTLLIPAPPESVKGWPLIGAQIFRWWTLAATDTQAILLEVVPRLKPFASKLLELAGSGLLGLLEFIASIIIAGFLYVPGPRLAKGLRSTLRRISGERADEMMHLAGTTILNVSRGVVGIALVQSLLAGIGFVVAGIGGAGFLTFLALILGIVQIGPSVLLVPMIIWSWVSMDTTHALLFTAYMIPVSLFDNVCKPVVMARGTRDAHARDPRGRHWRHDCLRDQRPFSRPDHSLRGLGPSGALGRGPKSDSDRRFPCGDADTNLVSGGQAEFGGEPNTFKQPEIRSLDWLLAVDEPFRLRDNSLGGWIFRTLAPFRDSGMLPLGSCLRWPLQARSVPQDRKKPTSPGSPLGHSTIVAVSR